MYISISVIAVLVLAPLAIALLGAHWYAPAYFGRGRVLGALAVAGGMVAASAMAAVVASGYSGLLVCLLIMSYFQIKLPSQS